MHYRLCLPLTFMLGILATGTVTGSEELPVVVVRAVANRDVSATAALSPAALVDLPLSASVLNISSFAERLPKDAADLADYTPGVSRRSNYWGMETPTFQLRGFNGGDSSAYFKDGFRYQGRGPVSLANVEAVEILRGPVSAVYGWSEPGGAVQLRVKQPIAQTRREFSLQTNNWGRTRAEMDIGGLLAGHTRTRLIFAHEQGGSFRDGQDVHQTLLAPSMAWDLPAGRRLRLGLEYLDDSRTTDYGVPAVDGRPADVPPGRSYTEDWGRQHSQSTRLTARWSQPAWNGDLAFALSHYQLRYLRYNDVEPYAVSGTSILRWFEDYPEQYGWTTAHLDWSLESNLAGLNHLLATRFEFGSERRVLYRGVLDEYASIDTFAPVYGQSSLPTVEYSVYDQAWTNRSIGWVLQDEIRKGPWTWLLGVRLGLLKQNFDYADHLPKPNSEHSTQTDRAVTPRLGVSWKAIHGLSLYANYASGKAPILPQSLAFDGGHFEPVSSRQWEAGLKFQPNNAAWLATAAVFDIQRRNVLTRDPDHPAYSIQTGVQRSRGVELAWQGELAPPWQLTAQTTWLDAEILRDNRYAPGNRLPYAPRFGASGWLSRRFATSGDGYWRLSAGVVHQGNRYANFANSALVPGYTRFDLGASYLSRNWSATISVENLSDRRYYASGVENRPAVIYPGAPRTIGLRVASQFR